MAKRAVFIDGTWLIFRAFYAIPTNFRTAAGLPTNAVYGFATMFKKLLAGKSPDVVAMVFDAPGATFRDELYPEYKGERPPMADDMAVQLPWIDKVVEAHSVKILRVPGYEADDVIGTLSLQAERAGMDVFIVTGDKDLAQLVTPKVKMVDTMRDVTYDPSLVEKKWGVPPGQIVDLLSMVGDKVDNVPGVPGIGQKGAVGLLQEYGSLEKILESTGALKGRQKKTLEANRDLALLSQELVTIDRQVPLPLSLDDLAVEMPSPEALNALYTELEFYSLLSRDPRQDQMALEAEVCVCASATEVLEAIEKIAGRVAAVQLLTHFESAPPDGGGLAGVAISAAPGEAFYVPLVAPDGGLGDAGLAALGPFLADAGAPKVAHDAKTLIREMKRREMSVDGIVGDTMLGSFLIDPTKNIPHPLSRVAKEYLQRVLGIAKAVVGAGKKLKRFGDVDAVSAAKYACHLADAVVEIWPVVRDKVEEAGQTEQLLGHDLRLSYVLADMELAGIMVDAEDLAKMSEEFRAKLGGLEARVHELAGRSFNLASTKQLSKVLFEELELPVIKKTKTGYSTAVDVLEKLGKDHEIARLLLDHRKLAKLINTYTDVLAKAADPSSGRIHTTFQQTTGATGRIITTDPDLQRTPVRTPEGRRIRRTFIAKEGCKIISADWSQIELRLLAHMTGDAHLVEAFSQEEDIHRKTAAELFECAAEDVTREQRNFGKTINFATIYGQGATALGQQLGVPRRQAKAYIARYFAFYDGVRRWLDATIEAARETGYVTTILGRRRIIHELYSKNPMERGYGERIAGNTPIQGSAADICKLAMLEIDAELRARGLDTRMLLQIHDELVFEVPIAEVEEVTTLVRRAMETPSIQLSVPLKVDLGVGDDWDAAH